MDSTSILTQVPGSILTDNSTYFSARAVLKEETLDATSVYNLVNFVECLVLAENVYLAPTNHWKPDDERLFGPDGPCRSTGFAHWTEPRLRDLFTEVVDQCLADVDADYARRDIQQANPEGVKTQLRVLRSVAEGDPQAFMNEYSQPVVQGWNDSGANIELRGLYRKAGIQVAEMSQDRVVVQFLLRTNVCLRLSEGVTYHPHSHRAGFVGAKIGAESREFNLAWEMAKATDSKLDRYAEETLAALNRLSMKPNVDVHVPMIFGAVLSGCSTPDDVMKRTLELRDSKNAREFRRALLNIRMTPLDSLGASTDVLRELQAMHQTLNAEIERLYGDKRTGSLHGLEVVASNFDLKTAVAGQPSLAAATTAVKSIPVILGWLKSRRMRRKTAFLSSMVEHRRSVGRLNDHFVRIFGRRMNEADASELQRLCGERYSDIRRLAEVTPQS